MVSCVPTIISRVGRALMCVTRHLVHAVVHQLCAGIFAVVSLGHAIRQGGASFAEFARRQRVVRIAVCRHTTDDG